MGYNLKKTKYIPAFKTKDAELKAYSHIKSNENILPLIELTRGRKSLNDSIGLIEKRIEKIKIIMDDRPFILDITSQENQINSELEDLLDPNNGFENWCAYLKYLKERHSLNIIPIIHLSTEQSDILQINTLKKRHPLTAIRLFINEKEPIEWLKQQLEEQKINATNIILILDCEYIKQGKLDTYKNHLEKLLKDFKKYTFDCYAILSSSYPNNIAAICNNDKHSTLPAEEITLSNQIRNSSPTLQIIHGDYCSIHPEINEGFARKPVPRIEFIYQDKYYYYRQRHEINAIAYEQIASEIKSQQEFSGVIDCWGKDRIKDAAIGNVFARNAANWISVRMNIVITTTINRL